MNGRNDVDLRTTLIGLAIALGLAFIAYIVVRELIAFGAIVGGL